MYKNLTKLLVLACYLLIFAVPGQTQISMPQIASLPTSNPVSVVGAAEGEISNSDLTGKFFIKIKVKHAPPGQPFPDGAVHIKWARPEFPMGSLNSTAIYQLSLIVYKETAPIVFVTGRGTLDDGTEGCVFWVMIADEGNNDQSPSATGQGAAPDVISFVVADPTGKLISYGAGAAVKYNIKVGPL